MTIRPWTPVALLAFALTGCGGSTSNTAPAGPTASQTATDVAEMLKEHFEATKKAPNSVADLTDAPASHPVGHAAVASQEYVVFWRVPISASGSGTVLAYHKDAPTAGGSVVMQDGSVKTMTADEFKAAPKAKK
jgi:hypothetical protein